MNKGSDNEFLTMIFTHCNKFTYIYIYNLKQCENSPTNTIISINFEDHDSDHGNWQIVYKKQCKTQKPTRRILKQAFDLLFQIFLRLCQLQSY